MTKTKELPHNIHTWVTALESGKYKQCSGNLYNGVGYCCVGVYAKKVLGYSDEDIITKSDILEPSGPQDVYEKIRDENDMKILVYSDGIQMNDGGQSFIDIAKMIREAYT